MPSSAPLRLVEFSRAALNSNLERLLTTDPDAIIDVRCDAYGHGADWVEDAARVLGFVSFLTDDVPTESIPESTAIVYGLDDGERVAVLAGEVVALKSIAAGESVSYGYTWTAATQTELALVSLGFADGLPRHGSNSGTMTIDGNNVPVVGRIAMDQCVLDVTGHTVTLGERAHVWDSTESLNQWAMASGRDPLSLVANLSWRVEREWLV